MIPKVYHSPLKKLTSRKFPTRPKSRDAARARATRGVNATGAAARGRFSRAVGEGNIFIIKSHKTDKNSPSEHKKRGKCSRSQAVESLEQNVRNFIKHHGIDRIAFWTLTVRDCPSVEEFYRRWDNVRRRLLKKICPSGHYIAILEFQKRGALHLHILVDVGRDIRAGVKWYYHGGRRDWRIHTDTLPEALKEMFWTLKKHLPEYGFGDYVSFMPLRTVEGAVSQYVAKYLWKGDPNTPEDAGRCRRVRYGGAVNQWKVCNQRFSWVYGRSWAWRKAVRKFAENMGIEYAERHQLPNGEQEIFKSDMSMAKLSLILGPRWAYRYRDEIVRSFYEWVLVDLEHIGTRERFRELWSAGQIKEFIPQIEMKYVRRHSTAVLMAAEQGITYDAQAEYLKETGFAVEVVDQMHYKPLFFE